MNTEDDSQPKRWIDCDVETEYLGEDRKRGKKQRKMAEKGDRSKYKKTDQDKIKREEERQKEKFLHTDFLRGRVLSILPEGIMVEHDNRMYSCQLRGLLKKDKSQFKNLVTVGDFVLFEAIDDTNGTIKHVEPRKSVLSRADNLSRRKEQLIAANIDQVIITTSVVAPQLKSPLIDRYVIATRKGGMEPIIVINKIDLLDDPASDPIIVEVEREMLDQFLKAYKELNIPVIEASVKTGQGIQELRELMKGKASVFSGQSGVGKSSLINAVTGLDLRVGGVVERTGKGAHTTTTANLLPLSFGGWCIDTPGIKSFGVWDLKRSDIEPYFDEIHRYGRECQFPDCSHINEQNCAVHEAVEKGEISLLRYQSYIFLMETVDQKHLRR